MAQKIKNFAIDNLLIGVLTILIATATLGVFLSYFAQRDMTVEFKHLRRDVDNIHIYMKQTEKAINSLCIRTTILETKMKAVPKIR